MRCHSALHSSDAKIDVFRSADDIFKDVAEMTSLVGDAKNDVFKDAKLATSDSV